MGNEVARSVTASVRFEGRLTRDEYARWYEDAFKRSELARLAIDFSTVQEQRIAREWELIRHSEYLLENFFKLPRVIQKVVESFAADECDLDNIESLARLSVRLLEIEPRFDFGDIADWELNGHLYRYIRTKHSASEMIDFERVVHHLVMLYNSVENYKLVEDVVLMLSIVHDLDFVQRVLEQWTLGGQPGTFSDFTMVVENWEKDFEVLPIEWVANIVRSENAE